MQRTPESGTTSILKERCRQIAQESFTPAHDDDHDAGELVAASKCYQLAAELLYSGYLLEEIDEPPIDWPWEAKWWKPSADPIVNLTKAGALTAAEIDRLRRNPFDPGH